MIILLLDIFSDVLRGSRLYEEIVDYPQYEIIDDKSNSTEVNVVVGNKKTFNGGNKPINLLNDEPPE